MPTAPLARRKAAETLPGYAKLLKEVRNTLLLGQERIEREKVLTYWQTGKAIHRRTIQYKHRADYGTQAIRLLSQDLKIDDRLLYYSLRFARSFPILHARAKLTWTHYRELAAIPDEKERLRFTKEAARQDWTTDQLVEKIRKQFPASNGGSNPPAPSPSPKEIASFKPKQGTVGAYRVVRSDVLLIDLGFSNFMEHPALKSGRFKEGDILSVITDPARPSLRAPGTGGAGDKDEAVYKPVTVTTTKPDKYDRYLSDLWIGAANLNQLLLQQGHARLLRQVSADLWNETNWGRF